MITIDEVADLTIRLNNIIAQLNERIKVLENELKIVREPDGQIRTEGES